MTAITRSALLAGLCIAIVSLPFAATPFLQDDYVFLYKAQQQAAAGEWLSWLTETSAQGTFWRPVSVGLYWLLVATVLGSSALAAHIVNASILGLASAAAGILAVQLAHLADTDDRTRSRAAFWATLLYGISGCWLLPVVWACAVQETLAILFSSLALIYWIKLLRSPDGRGRVLTAAASIAFLALALLSKEGAVVVPLLAAVIAVRKKPRLKSIVTVTVFTGFAVTGGWLLIRSAITDVGPESPYAPALGGNILKNALAMGLYMVNFPREAMAAWIQSKSLPLLTWGVVCFALQLAALAGFTWSARHKLPWKMVLIWVAVAMMPYLPLRSQSYPYYACLALLAYPIVVAAAYVANSRRFPVYAGLAFVSSILLYAAQSVLPQPAPIARARWAENALNQLATQAPPNLQLPIAVEVKSEPAYAAGGYLSGPALALKLNQQKFHETDVNTTASTRLTVEHDAYHWNSPF